jgi:hypothetical protein
VQFTKALETLAAAELQLEKMHITPWGENMCTGHDKQALMQAGLRHLWGKLLNAARYLHDSCIQHAAAWVVLQGRKRP